MSPSSPSSSRAARAPRERKPGRPEVPEDLERGCTISAAVTYRERDAVRSKAAATGLTVSELLRHAALDLHVRAVSVPAEFLHHAMQLAPHADDLRGMASNLNQLSKTVNTTALIGAGIDPAIARQTCALLPLLSARLLASREQLDAVQQALVRPRFK